MIIYVTNQQDFKTIVKNFDKNKIFTDKKNLLQQILKLMIN